MKTKQEIFDALSPCIDAKNDFVKAAVGLLEESKQRAEKAVADGDIDEHRARIEKRECEDFCRKFDYILRATQHGKSPDDPTPCVPEEDKARALAHLARKYGISTDALDALGR